MIKAVAPPKRTITEEIYPKLPNMAEPKKRKVESECRKFQTRWESEYFFKEFKGKCVCLICTETVAVIKEYNVRRHYETKHQAYASYTGAERE